MPGPHGYFWVPIIGPLIGGALGVYVYKWFIADTLEARYPALDVTKYEERLEKREDI